MWCDVWIVTCRWVLIVDDWRTKYSDFISEVKYFNSVNYWNCYSLRTQAVSEDIYNIQIELCLFVNEMSHFVTSFVTLIFQSWIKESTSYDTLRTMDKLLANKIGRLCVSFRIFFLYILQNNFVVVIFWCFRHFGIL